MKTIPAGPSRTGALAQVAILAIALLFPAAAAAQSTLEVFDIDTSGVKSSFEDSKGQSAELSIYFSAREANAEPIAGLKAEDIELLIDGNAPLLASKTLRSFKEGDRPVAVVIIFPIAKGYIEEFYGIRTAVSTFTKQFRQVDFVGAVAYDTRATTFTPATGDHEDLADAVVSLENTAALTPNLYAAFPAAIGLFKDLEDVEHKYLVIISDAEGAVSGEDSVAIKKIDQFQAFVKSREIRPLVVGYTPDGEDELTYRKWLKQMSEAGGTYTEAVTVDELPVVLTKVHDQIFQQYILDVEIGYTDDYRLEEGKYPFTIVGTVGSEELKGSDKAAWPALPKN